MSASSSKADPLDQLLQIRRTPGGGSDNPDYAEVVSSYLMFCYADVSLPVIGIGVLSAIETPGLAEEIFAAVIAAIALLAIAVDIHRARG